MRKGEKARTEKIVYSALKQLQAKIQDKNSISVFEESINKLKPLVETRKVRLGRFVYQVPIPVPPLRQRSLAYRWLVEAINKKQGAVAQPLSTILADEIAAIYYNGSGEAMKKKDDIVKLAIQNRTYVKYGTTFKWLLMTLFSNPYFSLITLCKDTFYL